MQKIIHTDKAYSNIHPIFDEIERLYYATSCKNTGGKTLIPPVFSECFKDSFELFSDYGNVKYEVTFADKHYQRLKLPEFDKKNIIVCFSGGKDSLASVLHYQKLGYNVYLYHITGLNKTYYNEIEHVKEIAQKLDLPLCVEDVSYKGVHDWVEHPIKNIICASMALQYGIRNNISIKVATGNFISSSIEYDVFEVCGGDTIEMWRAFERIVKSILPQFRMYIANNNYQTAFNALVKHPNLIPLTISCLSSSRFREQRHKWNLAKYGQPTIPDRCGSCWKCAVEYIWFCDHGIFEYDRNYYEHCLDILVHTLKQETGITYSRFEAFTNYFFYSTKKSKYWKVSKDAVI